MAGEARRGRQRGGERARESASEPSAGVTLGSAETRLHSLQGTLGGGAASLSLRLGASPRLHSSILNQSLLWPGIWFAVLELHFFLLFSFNLSLCFFFFF